MESRRILGCFLVLGLVGAFAITATNAQSPSPTSGCSNSIMTLSPCLSYINNITSSAPAQGCCSALSSVVSTSVRCLCTVLNSNNVFGFPINQTRALTLPGACKITTPPLSRCNQSAASPELSPAAAPKGSPATPTTPAIPTTPATPTSPATAPSTETPVVDTPAESPKPKSTPRDISPTATEGPTATTQSSAATLGFQPTSSFGTALVACFASLIIMASSGFVI